MPIHKKAEHAIYSSRREYFNSMDNSIGTQRTKKPLGFEIDSVFSANYVSPSSAITTFPQIAFSAFLNQQRNYFADREST